MSSLLLVKLKDLFGSFMYEGCYNNVHACDLKETSVEKSMFNKELKIEPN